MVQVDRHQRFPRDGQDALERPIRRGFECGGEVFGIRVASGIKGQIHAGHIGCWHPDRHTVQLACKLGQDQAHGLGCPGRGRDHRHRSRPRAIKVLVPGIQGRLVARVGMHRGHEATLDPDRVVQDLRHRGQAVRRARGIGHHPVIVVQRPVVDAAHDGGVGVLAGGRDQHPPGTGLQVRCGLVAVGEEAGAFQNHVDARPGQGGGIPFGTDPDPALADVDPVRAFRDLAPEGAMHAVIAQQMRIGGGWIKIVDRHDLKIAAALFRDGPQHVAADAAKAVDGNGRCR